MFADEVAVLLVGTAERVRLCRKRSEVSMSKLNPIKPSADLKGSLKLNRPEAIATVRSRNDGQRMPIAEGLVITTLPRGSLQIAQPAKLPEPLLKAYSKDCMPRTS